MATDLLVPSCGGQLVDLMAPPEAAEELSALAGRLPSIQVDERAACDLELLATGGFSPLDRFMGRADYRCVLDEMRLAGGHLFPIPVTLPVEAGTALRLDSDVALRDAKNDLLAVMTVEEIYEWDRDEAAVRVFGTRDARHPLVAEMGRWGRLNLSGRLRVLQLPRHYDFRDLRLAPAEVRARLEELLADRSSVIGDQISANGMPPSANGHLSRSVVAFQTRNPLHRAHEEMMRGALDDTGGVLLLHPAVGLTKPGDVDHYTRVRTYKAMAERYLPPGRVLLALLPLAMRLAGPREALWHALIRRNHGANHLIVGRDHASPGTDSTGRPFYEPYAAQDLVTRHADELGVRALSFDEMVYLPDEDRYAEARAASSSALALSGTQVREEYLRVGKPLPAWFTRPEVAAILEEAHPPRHRQGVCIWFTGLSGAGKSTTAEVLAALLLEHGRAATVLDGDVVRTHLSKGLGFSREDRDTNVRRIGFVAAEIVRHGGAVICAAVSPYREAREDVRAMVGGEHFVEVFVNTPLAVCNARDPKGLYARARRGEIAGLTGVDDPYEPPERPEVTLDTLQYTPEANARRIVEFLVEHGFLRG